MFNLHKNKLKSKNKNINLKEKIFIGSFSAILIFFLFSIASYSQNVEIGSPYIQNIPPKEYGYESQNYCVAKDSKGLLYVGNLSGVMQFDGISWRLIRTNGIPQIAIDKNDRVFVGGYNDFGVLKINKYHDYEYVSLVKGTNLKPEEIGVIQNVYTHKDEVFFCSDHKIFRYSKNKVELINYCQDYIKAFKSDNELFIFKYGYGLFKYSSGKFKLMPLSGIIKEKLIVDILPFNGKLLLKPFDTPGFYLYSYDTITPIVFSTDNLIHESKYVKGRVLANGQIVIVTSRNGLFIINKLGELVCNINRQNGLINDNITDVYPDNSKNIWLSTQNGVSKIEWPSAFSYFNESSGLNSSVSAITRYNDVLYTATYQGVSYYNFSGDNLLFSEAQNKRFSVVKGIETACYSFVNVNGHLLVSSNDGIYEIKGNEATLKTIGLLKAIHPLKNDSSVLLLGMYDGLHFIKYKNDKIEEIGKVKNFNEYIRTIAQENSTTIWLGSDYQGVFKMKLDTNNYLNSEIIQYSQGKGLPENYDWIDVYNTSKGMTFSTFKGLFRYNSTSDNFYKDTLLGFDFNKENQWIFPLIEDKNKNIWLSSGKHDRFLKTTALARYSMLTEKYELLTKPFEKIKDITIECIYPDKDSILWFGSFDGLIRYNSTISQRDTFPFYALIRRIVIGKDSVIHMGADMNFSNNQIVFETDTTIIHIPFKFKTIRFEFASPSIIGYDKIHFQYMLEGFDETWVDVYRPEKEFTNLHSGEYVFKVRAVDKDGRYSTEAIFKFEIITPFYRTWWAYIIFAIIIFYFVLMILRWRNYVFEKEKNKLDKIIAEKTEDLVKQKERAEELVRNILPKQTAEELKAVGRASRKKYKMVTVLFSDIQGFTKIAEYTSPDVLLDELDRYFLYFDKVVDKYGIEKIKTIGDAYMCAGGIPQKNRTNPIDVVLAAVEMQHYMKELKVKAPSEVWDVRIGIHTGSVIAGVVGSKKYTYDIWGDTVNIASRMESLGKPGEVNISETTYELVKDYFDCTFRGKVPVKYKGEINMYFVNGLKPQFSMNGDGFTPNQKFMNKLQLIRFDDLDELIMTKLERGLSKNLYYHDLKHTIDVCTQVEIIGRAERISEEDMLLLKTAALFHDAGFLIGYDDHEFLGIKMVKDILPRFAYTEQQIKVICDIIFATKLPPTPNTLLEQIICDADLDYLGRTDFIPVSQRLFRELFERNKIKSIEEWNRMQIKFIENHQYFTDTARKMRNVNKQEQLDKLKKLM